jgi:hypothetical protein
MPGTIDAIAGKGTVAIFDTSPVEELAPPKFMSAFDVPAAR